MTDVTQMTTKVQLGQLLTADEGKALLLRLSEYEEYVAKVASLDPSCGPMDIHFLVADAKTALGRQKSGGGA